MRVEDLSLDYGTDPVLRNVSIDLEPGRIIGLVGESGCGKSTLLRAMIGLLPGNAVVRHGNVDFEGIDILSAPEAELRTFRGSRISMVFQSADMQLSPVVRIRQHFYDALHVKRFQRGDANKRICSHLTKLGLSDPQNLLKKYSFELSGGMNQRVCIGLATIQNPEFLLADEPTSALDVTVQVQVLAELMKLRDERNTGILVVTHNMGVVACMADEVGIMVAGHLVEYGPKDEVFENPLHPYTKGLLASVATIDGRIPDPIPGEPVSCAQVGAGCPHRTRCAQAQPRCSEEMPAKATYGRHWAACFCLEGGNSRA